MSLFLTMFAFNLRKFKTLNELNQISSLPFIKSTFVLLMLSLAGVPPLYGFAGKFLMFSIILLKNV
jgi:NADH:ubiquinone oxidoreductase subunit 2 (subunit N)